MLHYKLGCFWPTFSFHPNLKISVISVVPKEFCDFDRGVVDIMPIPFYMVHKPSFLD